MNLALAIPGLLVSLLAIDAWGSGPSAVAESSRLEERGQFAAAAEVLSKAIGQPALAAGERKQLEFELDRLGRIRQDFPLTQEALFERLTKSVKGLSAAEFEAWLKEGRFDSPKQSLRSDNVDFQRGELEWGPHNIYFDQYSYRLQVTSP